MKIAHPKTNTRRTSLAKLCFDFMVDIVSIELAFCQQVATESSKIFRNSHFAAEVAAVALMPDSFGVAEIKISVRRERRENRYVKCEAIDSHILVRTHAIHLRLDSQFNLSRLIIPIGIGI
jgi:hypothetical protein